jgi:hypothetical protein
MSKSLDELLDDWSVSDVEEDNIQTVNGWWAVSNTEGVIAYFGREADAFRFRLAEINRELNG